MSRVSNGGISRYEFFFLPYPWRALKRYRWFVGRDTFYYEWVVTAGFFQFGRRNVRDL